MTETPCVGEKREQEKNKEEDRGHREGSGGTKVL